MGIAKKFSDITQKVQVQTKMTAQFMLTMILKIFSSVVLGFTIALVGQEMMNFGTFSLVFMMTVITGLSLRAMWNWSLAFVLIFDLICVLMALLFRMYLLIAP